VARVGSGFLQRVEPLLLPCHRWELPPPLDQGAYAICVFLALIDMDRELGFTQFWPGSHRCALRPILCTFKRTPQHCASYTHLSTASSPLLPSQPSYPHTTQVQRPRGLWPVRPAAWLLDRRPGPRRRLRSVRLPPAAPGDGKSEQQHGAPPAPAALPLPGLPGDQELRSAAAVPCLKSERPQCPEKLMHTHCLGTECERNIQVRGKRGDVWMCGEKEGPNQPAHHCSV
jgi:hypothetical protein